MKYGNGKFTRYFLTVSLHDAHAHQNIQIAPNNMQTMATLIAVYLCALLKVPFLVLVYLVKVFSLKPRQSQIDIKSLLLHELF